MFTGSAAPDARVASAPPSPSPHPPRTVSSGPPAPREHRLLRTIEHFTKQKIDVQPVPTVKDLQARRLEQLTVSLRERLAEGDFGDGRAGLTAAAGGVAARAATGG